MLRWCSVWYFVEIQGRQTELGVFETGVPLILGHGVYISAVFSLDHWLRALETEISTAHIGRRAVRKHW